MNNHFVDRDPWTPFDLLTNLYTNGVHRAEAVVEELEKRRTTAFDQADSAITEMATFGVGSLEIVRKMSEEWVKASFTTMRWWSFWLGALTGCQK